MMWFIVISACFMDGETTRCNTVMPPLYWKHSELCDTQLAELSYTIAAEIHEIKGDLFYFKGECINVKPGEDV